MSIIPGARCRSTRTIVFPGGVVRQSTSGTLVTQRENLGRELFTVEFDGGQKVILFAHEIELERDDVPRRRPPIAAVLVAGLLATFAAGNAGATMFSARQTHSGLTIERAGSPSGKLMSNGWFRRPHAPTYVYREGSAVVAGVWNSGHDAGIVRSSPTEDAPVVGRIVPTWKDDELELTIEPADGAAIRTTVFRRENGGGAEALDRGASTRVALQGAYRATFRSLNGNDVGWMSVDVDADGGTRFAGDLPPAIPPALGAAAAAAVEREVDYIYASVADVCPLQR